MKNVLVIVYYFPPMGGSGVQRPLKFVKYLREFGWNPIVLCPEPGAYQVFDASLQKELDEMDVEVHRVKGNTILHSAGDREVNIPERVEGLLRGISQFFWLPDNKKGWIKPGLKKAKELINRKKIDLVFATAPPYSNLMLAKKIKEEFGIPVVMDLRDDWLESHLITFYTRFHYSKMKKMEFETLSTANQIITINEYISQSIDSRIVNQGRVKVLPHGFDPDDFDLETNSKMKSEKISFLYSGTFYPESGPEVFLQAIATLFKEEPEYKEIIELQFQGNLSSEHSQLFRRYELEENVINFGFLEHNEAVQNLMNADVLWLNNSHRKNPSILSLGKTYEYMASRKPIIAMVPEGDVKKTLEKYGAAFISEPEDVDSLKHNIEKVINLKTKNNLPHPNQSFINKFNRKALTENLASIFNVISG